MNDRVQRPPTFESDPIEWALSLDPAEGVGSRHHTVPVAYLRNFAVREQVLVRQREGGSSRLQNCRDLGIKNFYTMLRDDGTPDAGLERLLGIVEGAVAPVIDRLINPLLTRRQLPPDEIFTLAQFVGFQMVRGAGHRREQELMADYLAKTSVYRPRTPKPRKPVKGRRPTNRRVSNDELTDVRIVGHQNVYLKQLGDLAEKMTEQLLPRPVTVVEVHDARLIPCDEPVLVIVEGDHVKHLPECEEAPRARRLRIAREIRRKGEFRGFFHVYSARTAGVADAEEVALTLSPRHLLIFGEKNSRAPSYVSLDETESLQLIEQVNARIAEQSFDWLVARPDHSYFDRIEVPPAGPLIRVCDGNTTLSRALEDPPEPRRPGRFTKDW